MKVLDSARSGFSRWLDLAAESVVSLFASFRKERTIRMKEEAPDCFSLVAVADANVKPQDDVLRIEDGRFVQRPSSELEAALQRNRLELQVRSDRFVFKPLEL